MRRIEIIKSDGETEPFDKSKLERSLSKAGAHSKTTERIVKHIMREFTGSTTTSEIYKHAFNILRKERDSSSAARYSVKRAVFALGPSGYPFERFFGEIMKANGWNVRVDVILDGRCVEHEVDALIEKDGKRIAVESKFHNLLGIKTDVKVALYVHSRILDLINAPLNKNKIDGGWLVTNTRFTKNAIRYGRCSGLHMVGWNYPKNNGIQDMIEKASVHPVTCLTTLTSGEKKRFLERGVVLCRSIVENRQLLEDGGVAPKRINAVLKEAVHLCGEY